MCRLTRKVGCYRLAIKADGDNSGDNQGDARLVHVRRLAVTGSLNRPLPSSAGCYLSNNGTYHT